VFDVTDTYRLNAASRASFGGIRTSCPSNAEPVIASPLIVRVGLRSGPDMPTQPAEVGAVYIIGRYNEMLREFSGNELMFRDATHSRIDDLTDGLTFLS
jgi:hypothetical protein